MTYETVEVPFVLVGNRRALTVKQLVEAPHLMDFVERFLPCFEYDPVRFLFVLNETDDGQDN